MSSRSPKSTVDHEMLQFSRKTPVDSMQQDIRIENLEMRNGVRACEKDMQEMQQLLEKMQA